MAENFYKIRGRVVAHVTGLADSNDFDFPTSKWSVPNVTIETYIVGGACDVKLLVDSAGDFSAPDSTITLDSFDSNGISEGNATPLAGGRVAGRITNTSGSAADFVVIGRVIDDGGW